MKKIFYAELAYVVGILTLALGTALMERADFGMSMVVAPAYILHLKISPFFPAFTFGMAEYCLQTVLILGLCLTLRRFKKGYIFSFVTAVVYGLVLDGIMALTSAIPADLFASRVALFILGMLGCSVGVAFLFHSYFAPEAYELVVKEVAEKYGFGISKTKTVYDLVSLSASVVLSFCFFGFLHFEGVKLGTLITALANGWMIGRISAWLDAKFSFRDRWNLRKYFEA